jgi:hypothetical protein
MRKLTKATLVSSLALAEIGRHREKGQINARIRGSHHAFAFRDSRRLTYNR